MISRKLVFLLVAAFLFSSSGSTSGGQAQNTSAPTSRSQSESLADAARKARAEKKSSGKPGRVFTNDDMGRLKNRPRAHRNQSVRASGRDTTAEGALDQDKDKRPPQPVVTGDPGSSR